MDVRLKGNSLIVTGSNRNGRFDFSYSTSFYFKEKGWPLPPEAEEILTRKLNPSPVDPETIRWKTIPWDHQEKGVAKWLTWKRAMLYHAMGAGKSMEALTGIGQLFWQGLAKRALILSPLAVFIEWPKQFRLHATEGTFHVLRDTKKAKDFLKDVPEKAIVLTNYEKLKGLESDLAGKFDIIVFDEATKTKNASSLRTKISARLAKDAPYVLSMTGTPISKNLIDVFGEYWVMDPFWFGRSSWGFRQRYCQMGGWMGHQIVGYQREEELRHIIDLPSHKITKEEALPFLPPRTFETRTCEMTPVQKKIYKETRRKFFIEFENGHIDIKNAASRVVKLQEIANGFVIDEEKRVIDLSNSKVDCLIETLEEIDPEERVTVWCKFSHDIEKIKKTCQEVYPEKKIFLLSGQITGDAREREIQSFKDTPGSLLLANIAAGGLGIDLTCCRYPIIFSAVFQFSDYEQVLDRHHRPGQHNPVTYISLLTNETVDERLQEVLENRKGLSSWIMENKGNLKDFFEPRGKFR